MFEKPRKAFAPKPGSGVRMGELAAADLLRAIGRTQSNKDLR
jgi:hypothetical protein